MPRRGYRRVKKAADQALVSPPRIRPDTNRSDTWQQDVNKESEGQDRMEQRHNQQFVDYYKHQKVVEDSASNILYYFFNILFMLIEMCLY